MDVVTVNERPRGPLRLIGWGNSSERPTALRVWAVLSLLANMGIVVTGGIVRVTGSGMGCPTWPRCTPDSLTPHPELGIHGLIEFGNRTLTGLLCVLALGAFLAALGWRGGTAGERRRLRAVAFGGGLLIILQGIVGGITVHLHLTPWIVGVHLLISTFAIGWNTWLVRLALRAPVRAVGAVDWGLSRLVVGVLAVALWLGTVTTGAGPHSGDVNAVRLGWDLDLLSRLHAGAVWVLLALVLVGLLRLPLRPVGWALLSLLLQGAIGYYQYFHHLPAGAVLLHMAGLTVATAAIVNLMLSVGRGGRRLLSEAPRT